MLLRNTTVAFFFFLLSRIEDTTNALNNQFAPFLRGSDVNLESLLDGDISPKVIGGIDVSNNVYPWFTRLFYSNNGTDKPRHCGGMLVTPFFVLTAAHCVNSSMKTNGVVVIGALSNDEDNGNQHSERILVKNAFVHPEYNYINIDKDFALLQLRERSSITPVDMDNSALSEKYSTGVQSLWAIGFGAEAEHDKGGADHLKEVEVGYVSNIDCVADCSTCDGYNSGEITENMMCASGPGKDACHGDSGGPLFDKGKNVVVGIVSFGNGCAQSAYPGVYSRISSQFEWIKATICNSSTPAETQICDYCSFVEVKDKTYQFAYFGTCWQIDLSEGGVLSGDSSDPTCTNPDFSNVSPVQSKFDSAANDGKIFFDSENTLKEGWHGQFLFKPDANIISAQMEAPLAIKPALKYFDIEIKVPNCGYHDCPTGKEKIQVFVVPDEWPDETSWEVENCSNEIVLSGNANGGSKCVDPGRYKLTMKDSYGDGLSTNEGGSYRFKYGDSPTIMGDNNFSNSITTEFGEANCVSTNLLTCSDLMRDKTLYLPDSSGVCLKIELFANGVLAADFDNPECSNEVYESDLVISVFDTIIEQRLFFREGSDNHEWWIGRIDVAEDPTLDAIDIEDISTWDPFAEKHFAYRVTFPSCAALAIQ